MNHIPEYTIVRNHPIEYSAESDEFVVEPNKFDLRLGVYLYGFRIAEIVTLNDNWVACCNGGHWLARSFDEAMTVVAYLMGRLPSNEKIPTLIDLEDLDVGAEAV